jgi:hypothetical protein
LSGKSARTDNGSALKQENESESSSNHALK